MSALKRLTVLLFVWGACGTGVAEVYGDLRLRGDFLRLQADREVDRGRLHGILGWSWTGDAWDIRLALRYGLGTDSNSDNLINGDNEESNYADLGEFSMNRVIGEHGRLEIGQSPLPLWLTPMVWDDDFRPAGLSFQYETPARDYDSISFMGGYWSPHHIDEYDTRLAAAQVGWQIREGAEYGGSVFLSYLEFDDLDGLQPPPHHAKAHLFQSPTRSNRLDANDMLLSDFELVNLIFKLNFPLAGKPATATVDLVKNLGANDEDEGARFSIVAGNAWNAREWEFGYAYQRIQQDAVMAAFNSDDWWFPTWMRGWSPWVAYGLRDDMRLRLAGFVERRDDASEHIHRVIMDFSWSF